MKKILYITAAILILGWWISITQYKPGRAINIMLYLGLLSLFLGIFDTWRRFFGAIGVSALIIAAILFGEWGSFASIGVAIVAFVLLARTAHNKHIYTS